MSKSPDKTVFEGSRLKALVIKEDNTPLFERSQLRGFYAIPAPCQNELWRCPLIFLSFMTTKQMAQRILQNETKIKTKAQPQCTLFLICLNPFRLST
jgi:hypothetical protein